MCALRDQGLTFSEIAKRMGGSRQTIQIIVSRARNLQKQKEEARQSITNLCVADMPLREFLVANDASTRLINAMRCNGYDTVGDVLKEPESILVRLPHMGKMSARELVTILERCGLALSIEQAPVPQVPIAQAAVPIENIPLCDFLMQNNASTRLVHPLINCNEYKTVSDLLQATERDLLWLPHMGKRLVEQLQSILSKHNLQMKG